MRLSREDQLRFAEALIHPPRANDRLVRAAKRHDAIRTVAMAPIGAHAMFADAIDECEAAFYGSFGFTPLIASTRSHTLYLPISTAKALIGT